MMHWVWTILIGFVAGFLAKLVTPGGGPSGFIITSLLGIAGSIVGGFLAQLFNKPKPGAPFHPAGIIMSIIGSLILIYVWIHFVQ